MPRPQFTPDEEYLIHAALSPTAADQGNVFMWAYLVAGLAIGALAAYGESIALLGSALIVVCGFRLYEERHQNKQEDCKLIFANHRWGGGVEWL